MGELLEAVFSLWSVPTTIGKLFQPIGDCRTCFLWGPVRSNQSPGRNGRHCWLRGVFFGVR
jgi:hypothetical protein